MLEIKNLSVNSKNGKPILKDISLTVGEKDCTGLTGASGSGKTTLIKAIMGMNNDGLIIDKGEILLDGKDLLKKSAKEHCLLCGTILGFIPQNPMTAFFQHTKIKAQMVETFRLHLALNKSAAIELAQRTLKEVNLIDVDRVLNAFPSQLSGGMLQRIAMAMVLGTKPKYILADEPTSALDEANRNQLIDLLGKYNEAGVLFISHDVSAMKTLCPTTYVMEHGQIIESGSTEQLFIAPKQPWTQQFTVAAKKREEVTQAWTILN